MAYVPLEKLFEKEKMSRFKLVLVAAMRANELAQGATPLVKSDSKKVSTIAMQEIEAGKVMYETPAPSKSKKS